MVETEKPLSFSTGNRRITKVVLPEPLQPAMPITFISRSSDGQLFRHHVLEAGAQIVVAGIERQQRRQPQADDADLHDRKGLPPRLADDEKSDRRHLHPGLPFRQLADRHADRQLGQKFPEAGDHDLAAEDDQRRQHRQAGNLADIDQHQKRRRDQQLVRHRIEKTAEATHLATQAGQIAI